MGYITQVSPTELRYRGDNGQPVLTLVCSPDEDHMWASTWVIIPAGYESVPPDRVYYAVREGAAGTFAVLRSPDGPRIAWCADRGEAAEAVHRDLVSRGVFR